MVKKISDLNALYLLDFMKLTLLFLAAIFSALVMRSFTKQENILVDCTNKFIKTIDKTIEEMQNDKPPEDFLH